VDHDPILKDIDQEYVEASAEALRLGRRPQNARPSRSTETPSLLARLQNPELRTAKQVLETAPARRR
jgi:hypothetical protein